MAGLVMHGSSTVLDHVVETVQGQDALEWLAQHQGPPLITLHTLPTQHTAGKEVQTPAIILLQ